MALILKEQWFLFTDLTTIAVDDVTQDYVDGDDGGWGVDGNPARADRCLVFWTKYIDSESIPSYVTQQVATQGTEKTIGVGDGNGLSNTDKTRFLVDYGSDGHYIFYLLPIERFASAPSGVEGDLYFNTTDNIVYFYEGVGFRTLIESDLISIEGTPGIAVCEELFDLNKRVCLNRKTRELVFVLSDDNEREIKNTKEIIRELRNKDLLWRATFKEGKQPTARKLLKSVEDVC